MNQSKTASKTLLLTLALTCAPAGASDRDLFTFGPRETNPNFEERAPWKEEAEAKLPPWPANADLVEFHPTEATPQLRYFIDTKSLSVDAQQIVRYTVVVESSSGARNVAYEGVRCTPNGQHRIYAYGVGGKFRVLPDSVWRRVTEPGVPFYAQDLERFFLCVPLKFEPRPVREMPRILSGHGSPRDDSGFLPD